MGFLLHLNVAGLETLPLKPCYPRTYPFTQMVNRVLIDQIDPFHYTLSCESISEILRIPCNNKSFDDMVEERANDLKAGNEPIYIIYSGDIDSSSVVLAFLRTWSSDELKRVTILASHHSVDEFPEFWNIIVDKFKDRILPSFKHIEYYCERGVVVIGEHGEQIFGADMLRDIVDIYGNEGIHKPWQEIMPTVYRRILSPKIVDDFIARYEQTLHVCPFPIRTSFDWIWWFNFTNMWQHVKYRPLSLKVWHNPKESFQKIRHFYDTPAWQRWSFANHDRKIGKTYESYKIVAKEYIAKNTGFWKRMDRQMGNLTQNWYYNETYEAIDTCFNYLTREKVVEYVR